MAAVVADFDAGDADPTFSEGTRFASEDLDENSSWLTQFDIGK